MNKTLKHLLITAILIITSDSKSNAATLVDFEESYNPGLPENYAYGFAPISPLSGPISLETTGFLGYSVSSKSAFSGVGPANDYFLNGDDTVSANGQGANGSNTWFSAYNFSLGDTIFSLPNDMRFGSVSINNVALLPHTIANGLAGITNPFDPNGSDFLRVRFVGLNGSNSATGQSSWIDLANFGNANDLSDNFVLSNWMSVDLSSLNTNRLAFEFNGSDVGAFGLNTPTYLALDNFNVTAVPEPGSIGVLSLAMTLGIWRSRRRAKRHK